MKFYVERKNVTNPYEQEVVLEGLRDEDIPVSEFIDTVLNMITECKTLLEEHTEDYPEYVIENEKECLDELQRIMNSHDIHRVKDTLIIRI